jgi:hypothetical protein
MPADTEREGPMTEQSGRQQLPAAVVVERALIIAAIVGIVAVVIVGLVV